MYMYKLMHLYVQLCVGGKMYMYMLMHLYAQMCVCVVCKLVQIYIRTRTHARTRTCARAHTHA